MIPHGHKKFEDFVELCNNTDWYKAVPNGDNIDETTIKTNLDITLAILREYYSWSFSQR